jgi:hypothetical protein
VKERFGIDLVPELEEPRSVNVPAARSVE